MTKFTPFSVNAQGKKEILGFLAANHKKGGDHFTDEMLNAWAADAEFQLNEGNDASIEIQSFDAVSGHTETYTISQAGLDSKEMKMKTNTYTIPANIIKALLLVAAKRDIRYYLNGIYVDNSADCVRLVATDGRILAVAKCAAALTSPEDYCSFIIPRKALEQLKITSELVITHNHTLEQSITMVSDGLQLSCAPIDGKYPDYRGAIPSEFTGEAAYYDLDNVSIIQKMAVALGCQRLDKTNILQNGKDAGLVNFGNMPIFGIIMPLNTEIRGFVVPSIPEWYTIPEWFAPIPAEEAKAA